MTQQSEPELREAPEGDGMVKIGVGYLSVERETERRFKQYCRREDRAMAWVLRRALKDYLDRVGA